MANTIVRRVRNAFSSGVTQKRAIDCSKDVSASARKAIMLTAEGNVCLSKGAVATKAQVASKRKKVVDYAF